MKNKVCCLLFLLSFWICPIFADSCLAYDNRWWTGLYFGLHGGHAWSSARTGIEPLPSAAEFVSLGSRRLRTRPNGGFGGGQIGYNCQWRCFVFGLETDFSGGDIKRSVKRRIIQADGTLFPFGFVRASQRTNWFGTIRARIGHIPFGCLHLIYLTAGFVYAHNHYHADVDFRPTLLHFPIAFSKILKGWVVGAGLEFPFWCRWSIKGEYLYYDLGHLSRIANPTIPLSSPLQVRYRFENQMNILRIGLNYKT